MGFTADRSREPSAILVDMATASDRACDGVAGTECRTRRGVTQCRAEVWGQPRYKVHWGSTSHLNQANDMLRRQHVTFPRRGLYGVRQPLTICPRLPRRDHEPQKELVTREIFIISFIVQDVDRSLVTSTLPMLGQSHVTSIWYHQPSGTVH
jgi:hypothetical protein